MKLDHERMKLYAKLPDSLLWSQIVSLAGKHGISLPQKTPPKEDMARLRRLMTGDETIKLPEAIALLRDFKRGQGGNTP